MSAQELWQWVHYCYGDELGLTSSDDDYIAPNPEETATLDDKLGIDGVEDQEEQELRVCVCQINNTVKIIYLLFY